MLVWSGLISLSCIVLWIVVILRIIVWIISCLVGCRLTSWTSSTSSCSCWSGTEFALTRQIFKQRNKPFVFNIRCFWLQSRFHIFQIVVYFVWLLHVVFVRGFKHASFWRVYSRLRLILLVLLVVVWTIVVVVRIGVRVVVPILIVVRGIICRVRCCCWRSVTIIMVEKS